MSSGIYKILNTKTNDFYIGSAVDFSKRFNSHKHKLRKNKHYNIRLQRAWNKYSSWFFEFLILENCELEKLIEREQFYIDTLTPEYNLNPTAGSNLGRKFGPHSAEHKKKIGEGGKGRIASEETRVRMSAWQIGRKMSDEAKQNMTLAKIGTSYRRLKDKWPHPDGCKCKCQECRLQRRITKQEWHKNNYVRRRKPIQITGKVIEIYG